MSLELDPDVNRISTLLQSDSKEKKKQALKVLHNLFDSQVEQNSISAAWKIVNKPLSRLLNDPAEICRDSAVECLKLFLNSVEPEDQDITYVLPILSRRLGVQEIIETSEEVRLKSILLIKTILKRYKDFLVPYIQDIINILVRGVKDNYAQVKKESCECSSIFAHTLPRHFFGVSEQLVCPLLENFTYKHHRIRMSAVQTIGDVILYGNSKSMEAVAVPMAERLFDQNATVRAAVVQVAGQWLQELKDRYSWWHKILPLVLTGLHDTAAEIRTQASELWDAAGKLYMQENENDPKFKKKMDYLCENPIHYPNVSRPNIGCRTLVQQNLGKWLNGIIAELSDWKPDIRLRSAQLLCVSILHVEENAVQHIAKLIPALRKAAGDQDKRVVENVKQTAEFLGYFVEPEIYCRFILSSEQVSMGHLRIVAAILKGSEHETLVPELKSIGKYLADPSVCRCRDTIYQEELLSCCCSIFFVCKEESEIIGKELFTILFTVLSMAGTNAIKTAAENLLNELLSIVHCNDMTELFNNYLPDFITEELSTNRKSWTIYCPESLIFCGCLIHAGEMLSSNLEVILPILVETVDKDADPELKLRVFITLSNFFVNHKASLKNLFGSSKVLETILQDCINPSLVWNAGGAAEPLRTAAVSCLCAVLDIFDPVNTEIDNDFSFIFEKIVPQIVSLCEDRAKKSRLYATKAIYLIMKIGKTLNCISDGNISSVYPPLLKRLDDAFNDIRYSALEALAAVWEAAPEDYDLEFNRGHIDALYTTVIVHLDDPEEKFQHAVLECLTKLAKVHPVLLFEKLQKSRPMFRNQSGIDTLIDYCRSLLSDN